MLLLHVCPSSVIFCFFFAGDPGLLSREPECCPFSPFLLPSGGCFVFKSCQLCSTDCQYSLTAWAQHSLLQQNYHGDLREHFLSELTVFCFSRLISFLEINPCCINLMSFKADIILPFGVFLLHLFLTFITAMMPQWGIRPHCPVSCVNKQCPWKMLHYSVFIIQVDFLVLYPANRNFPSGQFSTQCRVISPF